MDMKKIEKIKINGCYIEDNKNVDVWLTHKINELIDTVNALIAEMEPVTLASSLPFCPKCQECHAIPPDGTRLCAIAPTFTPDRARVVEVLERAIEEIEKESDEKNTKDFWKGFNHVKHILIRIKSQEEAK